MPTYALKIKAYEADTGTATQTRLVEARNEARALAHVTKQHIEISRPSSAELVALGKDGVEIESAE